MDVPCRRAWHLLIFGSCAAWAGSFAMESCAPAQAVEGKISADDPPPPVTYHGLIPGLSTAEQVRNTLGQPAHEAKWYAWKMLYPAQGHEGLLDSIHLQGDRNGTFSCVEAASVPAGYETRDKVTKQLGDPESELKMATFSMLDYTAKGVRFVFDTNGNAIGVAYFPHLRPRVHSGARRLVDLSKLRQGPQPKPTKPAPLDGLKAGVAEIKITPKAEWLNPPRPLGLQRSRRHVGPLRRL